MATCRNCDWKDVCFNVCLVTDEINYTLPALSMRHEKPDCFKCAHRYWRIDEAFGKRTCDTCKIVESLTSDSVKIKYQR